MPDSQRGSEWRKWDLHLHTPLSLEQQFGGLQGWDNYVKKIAGLPEEVKVIGITDYLFVDGFEELLTRKDEMPNIEMFLVNIEFRLDTFSGTVNNKKRHNFHVIFSPEVHVSTIKDQLLNCLSKGYVVSDKSEWQQTPTRTSLAELGKIVKENAPEDNSIQNKTDLQVGFDNITYSLKDIEEQLNKDCFKGKFVTAVGYSEWDQSRWDQSAVEKRNLINRSNFCLTSLQDYEKIASNIEDLKADHLPHRVLHSSDAHKLDDVGKTQLWVKADTTFEGLKQALYEYEERVRIQPINPYDDKTKYVFDSISLLDNGVMRQQSIPLNRDLVSIIGSKGSGKSLLLSAMSSVSDLGKYSHQRHDIFKNPKTSQVIRLDLIDKSGNKKTKDNISLSEEDENNYSEPVLYIQQEELSERSKQHKKVRKEYLRELGIEDLSIGYRDITDDIQYNLDQIDTLSSEQKKLAVLVEQDKTDGLEEYLKKKLKSLEETNKKLSNNKTRAVIEELSKIIAEGQEIKLWGEDDGFKDISLLADDINERIKSFNEKALAFGLDEKQLLPAVNTKLLETAHSQASKDISKIVTAKREVYLKKKEELEKLGVSEDIPTLLKTIENIQREIATHKKTLEELLSILETVPNKQAYISELFAENSIIVNRIKERTKEIDLKFKEFKNDRKTSTIFEKLFSNIDIQSNIFFDYKLLTRDIAECFYEGKSSPESVHKEIFGTDDPSYLKFFEWIERSFWDFISSSHKKNDLMKKIPNLGASGYERLRQIVLLNWYDYVSVSVSILHKFGNDEPKEISSMSTGELATVLLKLILVTQGLDKQIILLDQPEDHLDNDFIAGDLVELLKALKKIRQIIIVTHNANLVVITDSEQVIVAKGLKDGYISGAIENPEIRESIIKILEGGSEAFEKRHKRYGKV